MMKKMWAEREVLFVTAMDGSMELATALSQGSDRVVTMARSRRVALALLRRQTFAAVLVDSGMSEAGVTSTEMLWQNAGGAVPLEVDLRAVGEAGLVRLLCSVLDRRHQMEAIVRKDVSRSMANELRSTVTGMLLQSDLALRDKALTPKLEARVRELRSLANGLRLRLWAA